MKKEFLSNDYNPPQAFTIKISETETSTFTPEQFDERRMEQDDYGDSLANNILEAGIFFAQKEEGYANLTDNEKLKVQSKISQKLVKQINAVVDNAYANWRATKGNRPALFFNWDTLPGDSAEQGISISSYTKELDDGNGTTTPYFLYEDLDDYFGLENKKFKYSTEELKTIERGCYMFSLYGPNVIMALAVRSLLKQYAAFNASNVLVSTRLLTKFPHRRILETMQFLLDVISPGNMKPGGKGILAIKKLRLVHALVRQRIQLMEINVNQKFIPWQDEVWGKAINQQDMVFAIHTFSIEIIKGLQKVGYFLDVDNLKDDYYKTWHYIGRALGVNPNINCFDYNQGVELQEYIYQKQFALKNSKDTPNLTSVVLAEPLITFITNLIPFSKKREDALAMLRLYNDPEDYEPIFNDILGIEVNAHLERNNYGEIVEKNDRIDFEDLLSGALTLTDKMIAFFYKITSLFTKRNKGNFSTRYYRKIGAINRALFYKLEKMSKTWKGSSFSLDDGAGQADSVQDVKKSPLQGVRSKIFFLIAFAIMPLLFVSLGFVSYFIIKRIKKYGNNHPRPNLNNKTEYEKYLDEFKRKYKKDIESGVMKITS